MTSRILLTLSHDMFLQPQAAAMLGEFLQLSKLNHCTIDQYGTCAQLGFVQPLFVRDSARVAGGCDIGEMVQEQMYVVDH